jgi:HNH endonuclease
MRRGRPLRPLPDWLIVDDADRERVAQHNWAIDSGGYTKGPKSMRLHRFLLDVPSGMEVDHINGNKLDNRRKNLRIVTRRTNAQNQAPTRRNQTGVRGVWFVPDSPRRRARYKAQARNAEGRVVSVGTFKTLDEAAEAMQRFRERHHVGYAGRDRYSACERNKNPLAAA